MAKGKKTGGKNFQPGVVTNPEGRPKIPEELKEVRRMTRSEVELRILELWQKPEPEIKAILDDPKTSLRDKMIMRVMLRAIAKGDHAGLGFIMDTTFGKKMESSLEGTPTIRVVIEDYRKKDLPIILDHPISNRALPGARVPENS